MDIFDVNFENELIHSSAEEVYEEFLYHAEKRNLEPGYVVAKFINVLQSLGRKDGYIK